MSCLNIKKRTPDITEMLTSNQLNWLLNSEQIIKVFKIYSFTFEVNDPDSKGIPKAGDRET